MLSKIKLLCEKKHITIAELERSAGLARGTIGKWDTSNPSIDKVSAVADYFNVSIDELLSHEANDLPLNKRDTKDIASALENMRAELLGSEGLLFDGEPASPEAIDSILSALEVGMEIAKRKNKEKYTPKKYKK